MKKQASHQPWAIFFLLLGLSLSLRLFGLNAGFWEDEITTLTRFAHKGWLNVLTEIPYPNNHILYTLLLKLSINIFGEHEWSARLPALIFGALTPPICYLVLRKRFSEFVGICSGLFMALNYWMVWFSQDARGYSGMFLFSFLGTNFFLEYIERRDWRTGLAYVLSAGVSVYFHLYGIFIIAAQAGWAAVCCFRNRTDARVFAYVCAAAVLSMLLYLPGASQLYRYATTDARLVTQLEYLRFDAATVLGNLMLMLTGTKNWAVCAAIAVVATPGLFRLSSKWPGFAAVNIFSIIGVFAFTMTARVFIFPRFVFFVFPCFMAAVALGLEFATDQIKSKRAKNIFRFLLPALIAALLAPPLLNYYQLGKEPFKAATLYVRTNHPGVQVITNRKAMKYYMPEIVLAMDKSGPDLELVRGKLVFARRIIWENLSNKEIKKVCHAEKIWLSAGFEEHDFILLNCQ